LSNTNYAKIVVSSDVMLRNEY